MGGFSTNGSMETTYEGSEEATPGSLSSTPPSSPPDQWLLSTFYGSEIEVNTIVPANVPEAQNVTVTQTYTPSPGADSILTVSGVLDSGALVGILNPNAPVPGQVGPVSGTLATVQDDSVTVVFSDEMTEEPQSIGQVATAKNAFAWTQVAPGSDQWQVFYQNPNGDQTEFAASSDTFTLIDGSLDLVNNPQGDSVLWGAQAKDSDADHQQKFQIHRLGEEPGDILIATPTPLMPYLTTSGMYLLQAIDGRYQLDFGSPFWMAFDYYPESIRYRPQDRVISMDSGNLVVAVHAGDESEEWIDVMSLEGTSAVNRIPLKTDASSVTVCGSRVAWVETEGDVRSTLVYDTVTRALVYVPAEHNVAQVFCSNTSIATTLYDANNEYVGAEVVTFN